ncbi:hypothetical protein OG594_08655 [Streptomyces sp. NBC_01214]|uniref:hypothetical protein n=1 Tax=Streptomyces sp. NBC_01214 TaxID=2903777 RepID=UPI002257A62A|nr:hypothetical protein [Streptomyces sp. NBC_01214]MCX4801719.1 hypothetical protein [Streptomyces sp. NBC_01214]
MTDIIAGDPAPTNPTAHSAAAGLRGLADWLDANPTLPRLSDQRILLCLSKNADVEEFAAAQGWPVVYDGEGNASASRLFGPIEYHAYGYVDFDAHCAADDERRARKWAEKQGLEITAPAGGDPR